MFSFFSNNPTRKTTQLLHLTAILVSLIEAYNKPEQRGPEMVVHMVLNLSNTFTLSKDEESFLTDLLSSHLNFGQLAMLLKGAIDGNLPYSWLLAGSQAVLNVYTIDANILTADFGDSDDTPATEMNAPHTKHH